MKKLSIITLSLAAIVAGSLSSCQEEDMGVDYQTVRKSVYEKAFVSEFGAPAPDHKWGFDAASYSFGVPHSPLTRTSEGHVKKQDMFIDNVPVLVAHNKPADITTREHEEVAAWFRNHKVIWDDSPVIFDNNNPTVRTNGNSGVAYVQESVENYTAYGSLAWDAHKDKNPLGDYTINNDLVFHNGWVQNVFSYTGTVGVTHNGESTPCLCGTRPNRYACTQDGTPLYSVNGSNCVIKEVDGVEHCFKVDNNGNLGEDITSSVNISDVKKNCRYTTTTACGSGNMDLISFYAIEENGSQSMQDLNEFNATTGYGFGNQSGQNAILLLDANFKVWSYFNSYDSHYHDKYICVYLEGEGYSGYYLGFDFESIKSDNVTSCYAADGFCDDRIIKIGNAGNTQYQNARIMCEDLGANDFDFNDVVIDVEDLTHQNDKNYNNNNNDSSVKKALIKVTVKAVGGTIPVCLAYGNHPSSQIETVAFSKNGKHELHELFDTPVTTPINVGEKGVTKTNEISWILSFGGANETNLSKNVDYRYTDGSLDLQKINIYVRHSQSAEWLNVVNYEDGVNTPQKICVPIKNSKGKEVMWTKENEPIKDKYQSFKTWVEKPAYKFWEYDIQ